MNPNHQDPQSGWFIGHSESPLLGGDLHRHPEAPEGPLSVGADVEPRSHDTVRSDPRADLGPPKCLNDPEVIGPLFGEQVVSGHLGSDSGKSRCH